MTKKQHHEKLSPEEEQMILEQLEKPAVASAGDSGGEDEQPASSKDLPKAETFEERKKRIAAELERKEEEIEDLQNELMSIQEEEYLLQLRECADLLKSHGVYVEDLHRYITHTKDKKLSSHPFPICETTKFELSDAAMAAASTSAKTTAPKTSATKPVSPPKFFNPANHAETWSGRGAEPAWATPFRIGSGNPRFYSHEINIETQTRAGTYKPA